MLLYSSQSFLQVLEGEREALDATYARIGADTRHTNLRLLADVPAEESPEQVKSKSNNEFGPVTKIKVNKSTGRMLYCAGTSYCYNSNAFEFITPCRIKIDKEGADFSNYFIYFTR